MSGAIPLGRTETTNGSEPHMLDGTGYTRVAITLHWLIAAFILFNLTAGWFFGQSPFWMRTLHVSGGLTVLVLTALRVLWRALHEPPPLAETFSEWEKFLARLVHVTLYASMVLMPLSGWAIISANAPPGSKGAAYAAHVPRGSETHESAAHFAATGQVPDKEQARPTRPRPPKLWGVYPMPRIVALQRIGAEPQGIPAQRSLHDDFVHYHKIGAFLMIGLLFLHIAGALKHQWFDGHQEMQRMGLGKRKTKPTGSEADANNATGAI